MNIEIGDMVQWTSNGVEQFAIPKKVTKIVIEETKRTTLAYSAVGHGQNHTTTVNINNVYVYVEDGLCAIPEKELTVVNKNNVQKDLDKSLEELDKVIEKISNKVNDKISKISDVLDKKMSQMSDILDKAFKK